LPSVNHFATVKGAVDEGLSVKLNLLTGTEAPIFDLLQFHVSSLETLYPTPQVGLVSFLFCIASPDVVSGYVDRILILDTASVMDALRM
jgi:hypothetical protein